MPICGKFTVQSKLFHGFLFPNCLVAVDIVKSLGFKDKEAAVYPRAVPLRFCLEAVYLIIVAMQAEGAKSAWRLNGGKGGINFLFFVECNQVGDIHVADAVAVGKTECLVADKILDAFYPASCHGV